MAKIHSYIYGIAPDAEVRRITVSKDGGATHMVLGSAPTVDAKPTHFFVEQDRAPLAEAKRVFDLADAVEVPADLDGSPVSEKIRADIEVKAIARREAAAKANRP